MRLRADRRLVLRVATVLIAIVAILGAAKWAGLFAIHDRARLASFIAELRGRPFLAPGFIVVYSIAAAAGVPVTPLTLAGGVLFGVTRGVLFNWLADCLAASLAFAAARFAASNRRAASMSARTLFRLRLIPVVPFALLNGAAALSDISWSGYLLATAVGIIPVTVIYTISAAELAAGVAGSGARALRDAVIAAVVLIALSFLLPRLRRDQGVAR